MDFFLCDTQAGEPRSERMVVDQDWTAVYPTAKSFKPDAVPLPVRMGYPVKRGVPPEKKGNLELIKVRVAAIIAVTSFCFMLLSWLCKWWLKFRLSAHMQECFNLIIFLGVCTCEIRLMFSQNNKIEEKEVFFFCEDQNFIGR